MQNKAIDEIIMDIASRRAEFVESIRQGNYTPLLRLLEFPYETAAREILPAFEKKGLTDEYKLVSLQRLVGFAFSIGSDYWAGMAARWLEAGLVPDPALVKVVEVMIKDKRNSQSTRHIAFRAMRRWENSQTDNRTAVHGR